MDNQMENNKSSHNKALVLGILSIVFIFICQIAGLILGIIGLRKSGKDGNDNADAPWVLNVIGIVVNSVVLFLIAAAIIFALVAFSGFIGHMHIYHMW